MKLVPGKQLSELILNDVGRQITSSGAKPKLSIIQIGYREPSNVYIQNKSLAAKKVGITVELFKFNEGDAVGIQQKILELNKNDSVNGIIVQLPTPGTEIITILDTIDPSKDVDGLTSYKLGRSWYDRNFIGLGATPSAILYAIEYISKASGNTFDEYITGKNILIINHNILIGKPLAGVLLNMNATVTVAHSYTSNLPDHFKFSDIIITATGKKIITAENANQLKPGVAIVDSGFSRVDGKSYGDVDSTAVKNIASWLTPVPGGIGPLGVAMLMKNTLNAYLNQNQ
jgi:methylenetetrahydrofolate dehydrogenase (NADP+) / methenyltetrahydrofolate cyclohydrolase